VNENYKDFEKYMLSFLPNETNITDSNKVVNIFYEDEEKRKKGIKVKTR